MVKLDFQTRVDIVTLYKSGHSTRDIVLTLNARRKDVSRDNVRYNVKIYESGKFDPSAGITNESPKMRYVVSERDISLIKDFF